MPVDLNTATRAASNGYKVFRAARRYAGDASTLAKVVVDALGELAEEEQLVASVESVISSYGEAADVLKTMRDFGRFAGELADELVKRDSSVAAEAMIEAREIYERFVECDTDGSGTVSKEEFASFAAGMDMERAEALVLFGALDTDENGELSFQEWLELEDPRTVYRRLVKAARPARAGYKIFQAARAWTGDASVLTEVLAEGLGEFVKREELASSIESVVSSYGDADDRFEKMHDFGDFAGKLVDELNSRDRDGAAVLMSEARGIYGTFVDCDVDGSGTISKEEFIAFVGELGMSIDEALLLFTGVDSDRDGSISFQEWLEFMESPVGRDQHTFNCAGLHGLKEFKVPGEIGCEWCEQVIPMGSRALGCRLCDCDACLDCAALHMSTSEEQ